MDSSSPAVSLSAGDDESVNLSTTQSAMRIALSHCFRCINLIAQFGDANKIECKDFVHSVWRSNCGYCHHQKLTCGVMPDQFYDQSKELIEVHDRFWAVPSRQTPALKADLVKLMTSFRSRTPAVSAINRLVRSERGKKRVNGHIRAMEGTRGPTVTSSEQIDPPTAAPDDKAVLRSVVAVLTENTSTLREVVSQLKMISDRQKQTPAGSLPTSFRSPVRAGLHGMTPISVTSAHASPRTDTQSTETVEMPVPMRLSSPATLLPSRLLPQPCFRPLVASQSFSFGSSASMLSEPVGSQQGDLSNSPDHIRRRQLHSPESRTATPRNGTPSSCHSNPGGGSPFTTQDTASAVQHPSNSSAGDLVTNRKNDHTGTLPMLRNLGSLSAFEHSVTLPPLEYLMAPSHSVPSPGRPTCLPDVADQSESPVSMGPVNMSDSNVEDHSMPLPTPSLPASYLPQHESSITRSETAVNRCRSPSMEAQRSTVSPLTSGSITSSLQLPRGLKDITGQKFRSPLSTVSIENVLPPNTKRLRRPPTRHVLGSRVETLPRSLNFTPARWKQPVSDCIHVSSSRASPPAIRRVRRRTRLRD
ncbi:hypothetical protein BDP55DRAFT_764401 [Colletotrichum godetiae]|uniref:Uncharacterized protein n=1 Tax=Colletotrichum godetiae TaxID=1209918 RepID=A0AAJ0EXZ5_9PEZI|nr:uncharacterized protein BDP55DRAFT_764401 [Colletotrichum godetiae]KAK1691614.1 hypothetical protein BDP55DRAFT_764401 [Colletotrichum godetiae]